MSWLPQGTSLGRLRLEETFEYYDGPRLFSCRSTTGQLYVAAWAEEGTDHDLWLYLPISQERFDVTRSGGITVRDAFVNPEDAAFLVKIPFDGQSRDTIEQVLDGESIADDWLPDPSYRIELQTNTAPPALSPGELAARAQRELRPMLRVEIDPVDSRRTAAPTRAVGNLLVLTQNLLDNVGYSLRTNGQETSQRGRVPTDIQEAMSSEVISLTAASFVIDIASTGFVNLFGSPFEETSTEIVKVFALDDEGEEFKEQVGKFNSRAAKSFRKLVKHLASIGGPATLVSANETAQYIEARLPADKIQRMLAVLNYLAPDRVEPSIEGRMRLFKGDVDSHTFGADDPRTNQTYSGYVDEQAIPGFLRSPLGGDYEMVIAVTSVTDELTNDTQFNYRLMQITPSNP
ncbi:DUF6575 domain-containing protein [Rhodococcus sp. JS3073]|uniref:DUF6575 domain-containing protein n=1 Tax=Rhodococcus sp. JS3073 TaxID=3002901 RepID=UPI002286C152|nr:DUF6575 domain-containing protein [Rhodococcus sp. JS3073]WAM19476.1 hypothetical protein OYT95_44280 [Rhodococcus sp. JS3073]